MVLAEISVGVVSSLAYESIKKAVSCIISEVKGINNISYALDDRYEYKSDESNISRVALENLMRVLGGRHNLLSEDVAIFLRELQKTAFPEAIARAALCGERADETWPAFDAFCRRFKDLPFSSHAIMEAIHAACIECVNNIGSKDLILVVRAQHREMKEKLDLAIASFREGKQFDHFSFSEIREIRIKVAKFIESSNKYITVETLQGIKKLKLKSLAIPSRLVLLSEDDVSTASLQLSNKGIGYLPFRRKFQKAIILGDPGGGKSTLTQLICFDLASQMILEDSNPGRKDYDPRDQKVPIRIVLRSFESRQKDISTYTFFDMMRDDLKVALENDDKIAEKFLRAILASGEAIIIFDGLDEILDVGKRKSIINDIENFSNVYAACPTLVTSRLVGYRDAPLSDDFNRFGLARFTRDEIEKYSTNAIRAVSAVSKKDAQSQANDFIKQTAKIGNDIRENPLMLGLMVQIFVFRGDVPSNKPEVYKECATLMFEKWDGHRDIVVSNVPRDDMELLDVFGYVASRTFGDATNEEGVSKAWLTNELRSHFSDWYVDRANANRAAKSLVDFLTGRAWVMSEVGSGIFKFTHRTFLEYFFARHLISESESVSDLLRSRIFPQILKNEWVVISHLALHMAIFRDGGRAKQAAAAIIEFLDVSIQYQPEQELPLLEFVAASLDYLIVPEKVYLDIVRLLILRAIGIGCAGLISSVSILTSVLHNSKGRADLTTEVIDEVCGRFIDRDASKEAIFCIYMIGTKDHDAVFIHGERYRGGIIWDQLDVLRKRYKAQIRNICAKNLSMSIVGAYVYSDLRQEIYKNYGAEFVNSTANRDLPVNACQIICENVAQVASVLHAHCTGQPKPNFDVRDDVIFLRCVSDDIVTGKIREFSSIGGDGLRLGSVEGDLVRAIRYIWQIPNRKKKIKSSKEAISQILVCFAFVLNAISREEEVSGRIQHFGSRVRSVPITALEELIDKATVTPYREFLLDWISKRKEKSEVSSKELFHR